MPRGNVTADHGEGMGEHNYYFNHGRLIFNEQIHVPLLLRLPKHPAQEIAYPVSHVDVVPTLLELVGLQPPAAVRGRNLLDPTEREILVENLINGRQIALLWKGLKELYFDGRWKLYDVRKDFLETRNLNRPKMGKTLAAHQHELRARLQWWSQQDALRLSQPVDSLLIKGNREDRLRTFRALGYVQ